MDEAGDSMLSDVPNTEKQMLHDSTHTKYSKQLNS